LGTRTTALLTNMNQPLGIMCGNANEILESIAVLQGGGPADVRDVTLALGSELLVATGAFPSPAAASAKLRSLLDSGSALQKFEAMVAAQGGRLEQLAGLGRCQPIGAKQAGYISQIDARRLGMAIIELGGGRRQMGDAIDFSVGLAVRGKLGQWLEKGETLVEIQADRPVDEALTEAIASAFSLSREQPAPFVLLGERILAET
jgi:thymidine phosphorylase